MCEDIMLIFFCDFVSDAFPCVFFFIDTDGAGQWWIPHTQESHQVETEAEGCIKLICVIRKVWHDMQLY